MCNCPYRKIGCAVIEYPAEYWDGVLGTPFVQKHNLLEGQTLFAISRIVSSDGGSGELKNVFIRP